MLALLYDVHGNLPALEAVLADAEREGASAYLLGGDYALFGAWPAETVERLRGLDAEWIRGNGERWTARPADAPDAVQGAIERCRDLLGAELTQELGTLPEATERDGVTYCHGSPVSDVKSFLPEPFEGEEELLGGIGGGRLVFGHTHLPFMRRLGEVELVNPGSVGMPFDGDHRAAYALVADDGEVRHRRVAYDHRASAAAIRGRLGDAGEVPARRIEQAALDV